jgi:thermitase
MKTILIGFKDGAKPNEVLKSTMPTGTRGLETLNVERLHSVSGEVSTFNTTTTRDVDATTFKSDDELFDTLIYPTKADYEQKIYRTYKVNIPPTVDADAVLNNLKKDKSVEFAQFDEMNVLYFTPNDQYAGTMYGLAKLQCTLAWDLSQGAGVKVAVIDTGVDKNHPDISSKIVGGFDFSDNDADAQDYHGHGTHTSGTIGAIGNNTIGIIGVAPQSTIMPVKIFPNAWDSVCAAALKYAVDNGAKVLNNSWGPKTRNPSNPVVEQAIDYVHAKGGICIFAAGNNNDDVQFYSPANMAKVITVGATDEGDARAGFSNWGAAVDIAAPGVNIRSLQMNTGGYYLDQGTSMSAPHVAGVVALLVANRPGITFDEVRAALINGGNVIATDRFIGDRRLNAYGAIIAAGSYWVSEKRVLGLWTNSADRNAYVYLETVGWRRLAGSTDNVHFNLLAQLISAKEGNRAVSVYLSNNVITQIYN